MLLVLPALLLYPCLRFRLLEPDEGRYAEIPREMLAHGEWVVPRLQGEPYLDKPPLLYWLVMLAYQCFGASAGAARLVPALAVHGGILLTYFLGRRSLGKRAAFWAALVLTLAPGYLGMGRLLILDGLLTFCVTLSLLAGFEAVRGERFRPGWWLLASVACGLGVLTKGPIAVVLLAGPLVLHQLLTIGAVRVGWRAWVELVGVVLAVNLPWYVAMGLRQPEFVRYFLWEHNVVRFLSPFDHLRPIWFYLPILAGGLFPTALLAWPFVRFLLSADTAAERTRALGFWLLAGGWCVLFFSLSGCKLPTYVLPAFPPLALALGVFIARTRWHSARLTRVGAALGLVLFLAANYVALPWYAQRRSPMGCPEIVAHYCADPRVPVVCYPRPCDSVAFYLGRDDLRSVRSKYAANLVHDLQSRPRTVVLFTHRHSLEALRYSLPGNLKLAEVVNFKHPPGPVEALDVLGGDVPWGLCNLAVIERGN